MNAARDNGAHITHYRSDSDESLVTTVARFGRPAGQAEKVLLIISGLHGAEGKAGAEIEIDAITRGQFNNQKLIEENKAVVAVHALDPYGFMYDRRGDRQGIDANRAMFLPGAELPQDSEANKKLNAALTASGKEKWNRRDVTMRTVAALLPDLAHAFKTNGIPCGDLGKKFMSALKVAASPLMEGSNNPYGLFYRGGGKKCGTLTVLQQIIDEHLKNAKKLHVLDIHTGLGNRGTAVLIVPETHPRGSYDLARAKIRGLEVRGLANGDTAANTRGDAAQIFNAMADHGTVVLYGALEIGVLPYLPTGMALGHAAHVDANPNATGQEYLDAARDMREAFAPEDPEWMKAVRKHGERIVPQFLTF
ncbi:MAG: DUF2817 domain-containing protein [Alphaproteobacteria bacterium]|nr:DUF2817 domain-containing protein [Alphaproteobacteria bacterium]